MSCLKKISAEVIADSINTHGDRITTFLLTYPRFIHAELMTHRVFSRNSASSRAIPFEKMLKMVEEDPFIPIAWQKNHKGMQGTEYFTNERISNYSEYLDGNEVVYQLEEEWLEAKNCATEQAKSMNELGLTKQLCNRLLEPVMWHTTLITATSYENFFDLRCPKYTLKGIGGEPTKSKKDWLDKMKFSSALHPSQYPKTIEDWLVINESQAEIHIQALAESMWDEINSSKPKVLQSGEWHVPYGDNLNDLSEKLVWDKAINSNGSIIGSPLVNAKLKIATARAARISFTTLGDNPKIDYEADIKLHDKLLESKHLSCFEHCARAMSDSEYQSYIKGKLTELNPNRGFNENIEIEEPLHKEKGWCNNFKGFIQYRYLIENNEK